MTGNGRAPQDQAQSLAKAGALIKATLDAGDQFRRSAYRYSEPGIRLTLFFGAEN